MAHCLTLTTGAGGEGDSAVEVRAQLVRLQNISVTVSGDRVGSVCVHSGSATLHQCELMRGQLYVEEEASCVVTACTITESSQYGVSIQGRVSMEASLVSRPAMEGIHVYERGELDIGNCTILESGEDGIAAEGTVTVNGQLRVSNCQGYGLAAAGELGRVHVRHPAVVELEDNVDGGWDAFDGGEIIFEET